LRSLYRYYFIFGARGGYLAPASNKAQTYSSSLLISSQKT